MRGGLPVFLEDIALEIITVISIRCRRNKGKNVEIKIGLTD